MRLTYSFYDADENGPFDFEYYPEYDDIVEYIDTFYTDKELVDLYIDRVYNRSEVERQSLYDEFGIASAYEFKKSYNHDTDFDWVAEAVIDNSDGDVDLEQGLTDFLEDKAYEEFLETPDMSDVHNEWERDYLRSI